MKIYSLWTMSRIFHKKLNTEAPWAAAHFLSSIYHLPPFLFHLFEDLYSAPTSESFRPSSYWSPHTCRYIYCGYSIHTHLQRESVVHSSENVLPLGSFYWNITSIYQVQASENKSKKVSKGLLLLPYCQRLWWSLSMPTLLFVFIHQSLVYSTK